MTKIMQTMLIPFCKLRETSPKDRQYRKKLQRVLTGCSCIGTKLMGITKMEKRRRQVCKMRALSLPITTVLFYLKDKI